MLPRVESGCLRLSQLAPYRLSTQITRIRAITSKDTGLKMNNDIGVGPIKAITTFCAHLPDHISNRRAAVSSLFAKSSSVGWSSVLYQPVESRLSGRVLAELQDAEEDVLLLLLIFVPSLMARVVVLVAMVLSRTEIEVAILPLITSETVFIRTNVLSEVILGEVRRT